MVPSRRQVLAWPVLALVAAGCTSAARRSTAPAAASVADRIPPFLAAPDVNGAGLLAIAMGESGEPRWVPHLLDLLRVIGDEDGAVPIMVALQRITGELTVNDAAVAYAEHGSWMQRERPDPGEGYDVWKRTLYRRIDPTYDVLLAGTTDRLLLAEIQWGGVVRGGIPELNRPARAAAAATDVAFLTPDELVFGVVHGGETVAYPERVLGYHELANDVVGGEELVVSYCPLCRSARAFVADGRSMQTSGLLRLSNKLMVDRATGSLWQQTSGRALTGAAVGASLPPVAMVARTWSEWFGSHPETAVVLRPDPTEFPSTSYRYEPLDAYDHYDADPSPWFPVLRPPGGLRPKATVATFAAAGQALAVDTDALARAGPVVIAVDGGPVRAVLAVPTASGARLYDATDATDAALAPGPVAVVASDEASATLGDGRRLPMLPTDRSTWFAFYGEHRAKRVVAAMTGARCARRFAGVLAAVLLAGACTLDGSDADRARLDGLVREMAERPLSDTARQVVAAVARRGDPSYGAYLLDLARIGFSSAAADEALDALAGLSGLPRGGGINEEYLRYGRWVLEKAPAPGSDYVGFKAAVYRQVDPAFVALLERVDDPRVLAGLQWGGVGVGAIGELNGPVRVPMVQPAWAQPDEQIFGLVGASGTALAYPERILGRHELANDVLDGMPVAVTFCTLCRSVRVYDRRVDGRVLTLRTSGLLLRSNKVMIDTETGSLWQQYNGEGIAGPLRGRTLQALDVEISTWGEWLAGHPAGLVVDRPAPTVIDGETGVPVGYDYEPGAALAHYYASDELWYPVLAAPADLAPKTEVATISIAGGRLAVSVEALAVQGPRVFRVGQRLVVAMPVPASVRFHDATGTGWAEGPLPEPARRAEAAALARLPGAQSFWFAWYGEHPDTDWWPRVA